MTAKNKDVRMDINHEAMKAKISAYMTKQVSYYNAVIFTAVNEIEFLENEVSELRKKIKAEKDIIKKAKKEIEYYSNI